MFIKHLIVKKYRAISFLDLVMPHAESVCMVGANGCGKTTVLNLICGLTGVDCATSLIAHQPVEYCSITVNNGKRLLTFEARGIFDPEAIQEFKNDIKTRSSFVWREEIEDDRFVGVREDGVKAQAYMSRWLEDFDIPLEHTFTKDGGTFLISETGAQRNVMTVAMRLPPPLHYPILTDFPERSLHYSSRRYLFDFYQRRDEQVFAATHCPETMESFRKEYRTIIYSAWDNK